MKKGWMEGAEIVTRIHAYATGPRLHATGPRPHATGPRLHATGPRLHATYHGIFGI